LPSLISKLGRYTICEGDNFALEVNVEDLPFGLSASDTVMVDLYSTLPGASLEKIAVNYAPYFKYVFKVEPALGQFGEHTITLNLRDSRCPLIGQISKSFTFVVQQKRSVKTLVEIKNCGMLNANCQNFPNKFITWTLRDGLSNIVKQQIAKKFNMQLLNSGVYYLESILPAEKGFCEVRKIDTLTVPSVKTPILNMGPDYSVCKGLELNISPEYFETFDAHEISVNGVTISGFPYKFQAHSISSLSFKVTQKNGCTYEDKLTIGLFGDLKYKVVNDTICSNGVFPMAVSNIDVDKNKILSIDYIYNSNGSILSKQNPKDWTFDFTNKSNPTAHKMVLYSVLKDLNSCKYFDTSIIQVLDPSQITVNAPSKLCVNAEVYNLETKLGGAWECVNYPSLVKNNQLKLKGASLNQLVLKYSETKTCINTKTFFVDLMDTSEITFLHPRDLLFCENSALYELKPLPAGGDWIGDGVQAGMFNPSNFGGKKFKILYKVSNQDKCISRSNLGMEVEKLPSLKVIAAKETVCVGEALSLQALSSIAGNGYWYSDGAGRFDNATSQLTNYQANTDDVLKSFIKFVYTLQTYGICGNVSSDVFVKIKNGPSGDIIDDYVTSICEPAKFVFKSNYTNIEKQYWFVNDSLLEEFDYNFNFGVELKAGEYVIKTKVADSACEALAISQTITVLPTPKIELLSNPNSRLSHEYPRLFLKDKTTCKNGHSVKWYFNQTWIGDSREFYYTVDDSKDTFTIKLVAESGIGGCKDSSTQMFVFTPINQLYIPDAFSPDTKGPDENNKFKVKGPAMREFEIEIFNKYGEKVFVSNNMNEAWDGTYKSIDCMMGVYFYKIITTDYEGISRDYSGTLTLVR
jgi:gliding motility-associated-like protein